MQATNTQRFPDDRCCIGGSHDRVLHFLGTLVGACGEDLHRSQYAALPQSYASASVLSVRHCRLLYPVALAQRGELYDGARGDGAPSEAVRVARA